MVAMEVKSGTTMKSKSLTQMINEGAGRIVPIKVSWNGFEMKDEVLHLPVYLVERWEEFIL